MFLHLNFGTIAHLTLRQASDLIKDLSFLPFEVVVMQEMFEIEIHLKCFNQNRDTWFKKWDYDYCN